MPETARPESFRSDSKIDALRVPPQSVEAEQAVLGGLMLSPNRLAIVADLLTEEDFYRRDHRLIYRAIRELSEKNKPFDSVMLGEWLEASNLSDQIGGTGYLIDLASNTPSAANIKAYSVIVSEKAELRRLIDAGTDIVNDGFQPDGRSAEEVVAQSLSRLLAFKTKTHHGGLKEPKAGLKTWYAGFLERFENHSALAGLPTPWHEVNKITRGLRTGLIILAGRPGMGKSIATQQLSAFTALRGQRVALFSVEMTEEENHQRNISAVSGVPHDYLVAPGDHDYTDYHDSYLPKITLAIKDLLGIPLFIDDEAGLTAHQICARARREHAKAPLAMAVVDHLHDVKIPGKDPVREYGDACQLFKQLAKELDIPVVVVAQLNRALATRTDKRPTMTDLRASGEIEQKADLILFIHREDYYDTDEKKTHLQGVVELSIGKGRNMRSNRTMHLLNEYDCMRLGDWDGQLPQAPVAEKKKVHRGMPPAGDTGLNFPN